MLNFQSTSSIFGSGRRAVYVAFNLYDEDQGIEVFRSGDARLMDSMYRLSMGCDILLIRGMPFAHALKAVYKIDRDIDLFWGSEQMRMLGRMPAPQRV